MDAPKGRYRVEEKDGRLVVIDTRTGAPATPVGALPSSRPSRPSPRSDLGAPRAPLSPPRPAAPIAAAPHPIDWLGRLLLYLVVRRWEKDGRAVVAWEWEQKGQWRRWDATLDPVQQRRLGRALLGAGTFPLLVVAMIAAGPDPAWLLLPLALPATLWGIWSILRLQRETGGKGPA